MYIKFIVILSLFFLSFSMLSGKNTTDKTDKIEGILYSDGKPVSIHIVNGKITGIKHLKCDDSKPKIYVAPGLIDIQINGYMGVDFSDTTLKLEDLRKATRSLRKVGVTTFLPTVVANSRAHMKKSFQLLSEMLKDEEIGLSIPGFHLEGPYLSPVQGYRGAHLEKNIRLPDWEEFSELKDAAQNKIKIITLAPEVKGAIPFIRKCIESGLVVSLGHHNGSADDINSAVEAGASLSTHLGNGCANMIDRHLNPLWPQLANDKLTATIIVDGFHLTKEEVRTFYKVKGSENTILVSDAVDLAGLPPGEYLRREKRLILTPENVVKFPVENVLAGAATPISTCVGNVMKFTGCGLAKAIQMASTNPARLLSLNDLGEIKEGKRADLIVFRIENNKVEILKTIVDGKVVYSADRQ
jgi:N-acetylglucosamine-6-phosphate deacetylase